MSPLSCPVGIDALATGQYDSRVTASFPAKKYCHCLLANTVKRYKLSKSDITYNSTYLYGYIDWVFIVQHILMLITVSFNIQCILVSHF